MRRRLPVALLALACLLPACSGDDDALPSSTSAETVPPVTEPDEPIETTPPPETTAPPEEEDIPVLDDVVAPPFEAPDRTTQLTMQLGDGAATLQEAIDVFSLTYLPLPGTTETDLPPGEGFGHTYALALITSVRDRLSPEQLAIVDSIGEGAVDLGVFGGEEAEGDGSATTDGTSTTVAARQTPLGRRTVPPIQPVPPLDNVADMFRQSLNDWREYRPDFPRPVVHLSVIPTPAIDRAADAVPRPDGGCNVRLFAPQLDGTPTATNVEFWRYVMAHELFHCMQFTWDPSYGFDPVWLIEGSANFAAFDLYSPRITPKYFVAQTRWFDRQDYPLAARDYDAWPLYESFRQWRGGDVYATIQSLFLAEGGVQERLAAVGMDQDEFLASWTSLSARPRKYSEPEWTMRWPGPLPLFGPHDLIAKQDTRGLGQYRVIGTGDYSHKPVSITMTSDVDYVIVESLHGPLRTHAQDGTVTIPMLTPVRFCFVGDQCVCPGGSSSNTIQMDERDMTFAFAAGRATPTAHVVAKEWDPDKECEDPKPPSGESNGDPHLVTFDGLAYDVMTMGEFVLSKDPAGDFEVQQRHEPFGFGAGTSAVAIGTGDHRVTLTADGFDPDGVVVVRSDGVVGDGDLGAVTMTHDGGDEWTFTWPDESSVVVTWSLGFFVSVRPSAERAGDLVGLLGSVDGNLTNDLVTPDGELAIAGQSSDWAFVPLWQVDEDTTFFDYGPDESIATFVNRPPADPSAPDDELIAECETALGPDAAAHDVRSCAFDVASTGEEGFIEVYTEVVENRSSTTGSASEGEEETPPTTPPGETGPTLTVEGTVYDGFSSVDDPNAVSALTGSIDIAEGSILVATVENCPADVEVSLQLTNRETGGGTTVYLCDTFGFNSVQAEETDEVIAGESYALVTKGGVYAAAIVTSSTEPIFISATLSSDPTPTVLTPEEFVENGFSGTMEGIGDTVYLPMSTGDLFVDWTITASEADVLCTNYSYAADPIGEGSAIAVPFCGHPESIGTTPTGDLVLPAVLFSRTDGAIDVEFTPVAQ